MPNTPKLGYTFCKTAYEKDQVIGFFPQKFVDDDKETSDKQRSGG